MAPKPPTLGAPRDTRGAPRARSGRLGSRDVLLEPALRLLEAVGLGLFLGREPLARHRQVDRPRVRGRRLIDGGDDGPPAVALALRDDGDITALPGGRELLAVDHGRHLLRQRRLQPHGHRANDRRPGLCFPRVTTGLYRAVNRTLLGPRPTARKSSPPQGDDDNEADDGDRGDGYGGRAPGR